MTAKIKFGTIAVAVLALFSAQASFADPTSSCGNVGTPSGGYVNILCNLYYNGSPNAFDLSGLMTEDGSLLSNNDFGANYTVVINGNPATMTDDSGVDGLFNESNWEAVLFFPGGDPDGADYSDMLDVLWPGTFPSSATIQSFNEGIYGASTDADFFVQATGSETIIGAGSDDQFDVFTAVPEPAPFALMLTGMLSVALLVGIKRQRTGPVAQRSNITG